MSLKEEITVLRDLGKTYNQIAAELGCSKGTISYHCNSESKVKTNGRRTEYRKRNKAYIDGFKRSNPCQCGETDIKCLDFHHTDPENKRKKVADIARDAVSIGYLQEEIDKCIVICSNCHRNQHYKGGYKTSRNREYIKQLKSISKCLRCGHEGIASLDFHHRNPNTKCFNVTDRKVMSMTELLEEIDKCDILCSNCHRKEKH